MAPCRQAICWTNTADFVALPFQNIPLFELNNRKALLLIFALVFLTRPNDHIDPRLRAKIREGVPVLR
jgi:hypothetical protein